MGVEAAAVVRRAARALSRLVAAVLAAGRKPDSLHGLVALVWGAGSGLGRELSLRLALCGCRLICLDEDAAAAAGTADAVNRKVGAAAAEAVSCDCGDHRQVAGASRALLSRHGAVDVLVLADPPRPGAAAAEHLAKLFWVSLGVVPGMAARGGGRVLVVCSEDCPAEPLSVHSVATDSLAESLSDQLRGSGVSLTCAYHYRFSSAAPPLSIPELSDEQAASEMVAALRRRQGRVVLPRRPLFWSGVLRSLHLVAEGGLHDALCLEAPPPAASHTAAAASAAKS